MTVIRLLKFMGVSPAGAGLSVASLPMPFGHCLAVPIPDAGTNSGGCATRNPRPRAVSPRRSQSASRLAVPRQRPWRGLPAVDGQCWPMASRGALAARASFPSVFFPVDLSVSSTFSPSTNVILFGAAASGFRGIKPFVSSPHCAALRVGDPLSFYSTTASLRVVAPLRCAACRRPTPFCSCPKPNFICSRRKG